MKWLRYGCLLGLATALNAAGCDGLGQGCTEIGCANGVMIDVLPESGLWPDGSYSLLVALDDQTFACDFTLPDAVPAGGSVTTLACGEGLLAMFAPRVTCTETRNGNSASQHCTPLPDQYDLLLSAYGEPTNASVSLTRDGDVIVSDARDLVYAESHPNGEECGPACRQSHVVLAVEE